METSQQHGNIATTWKHRKTTQRVLTTLKGLAKLKGLATQLDTSKWKNNEKWKKWKIEKNLKKWKEWKEHAKRETILRPPLRRRCAIYMHNMRSVFLCLSEVMLCGMILLIPHDPLIFLTSTHFLMVKTHWTLNVRWAFVDKCAALSAPSAQCALASPANVGQHGMRLWLLQITKHAVDQKPALHMPVLTIVGTTIVIAAAVEAARVATAVVAATIATSAVVPTVPATATVVATVVVATAAVTAAVLPSNVWRPIVAARHSHRTA